MMLWLLAVLVGTGIAGLRGKLPGVEPAPYILRFSEDRPNPLYRRICYTLAWSEVVSYAVLNSRRPHRRDRQRHLADARDLRRRGTADRRHDVGARRRRSAAARRAVDEGEGTERRYFYGSVWAVCIAQPVLWLLWKVLPATRDRPTSSSSRCSGASSPTSATSRAAACCRARGRFCRARRRCPTERRSNSAPMRDSSRAVSRLRGRAASVCARPRHRRPFDRVPRSTPARSRGRRSRRCARRSPRRSRRRRSGPKLDAGDRDHARRERRATGCGRRSDALVAACDGFLRREAIAASLTDDERRRDAARHGADARPRQPAEAVLLRVRSAVRRDAVSGQGVPIARPGSDLRRGDPAAPRRPRIARADGTWQGDVIGPIIRDLGAALAMRPEPATDPHGAERADGQGRAADGRPRSAHRRFRLGHRCPRRRRWRSAA